jgi:hypothetical protein
MAALIAQYKVIPELVINFDQTAIHVIPKSKTTYAPIGVSHVPLSGSDDKRQVTAVVASSASGALLPIQMIFKGTTTACHPEHTNETRMYKFLFSHSESHWSTHETMIEYFDQIILPYIEQVEKEKQLNPNIVKCIVVLDCWRVHMTAEFRSAVSRRYNNKIMLVYIPPNCTSELQVADVALNYSFKRSIRNKYEEWSCKEMLKLMEDDTAVPKLNTTLTVLKPLMLNWTFQSWFELSKRSSLILKGWKKCATDILDIFDIKVQEVAREKVMKQQLEAYGFVYQKPEENPNYYSEDSDSELDELDIYKLRPEPKRKSSRIKKQATLSGYMIDSQRIEIDSDSEVES